MENKMTIEEIKNDYINVIKTGEYYCKFTKIEKKEKDKASPKVIFYYRLINQSGYLFDEITENLNYLKGQNSIYSTRVHQLYGDDIDFNEQVYKIKLKVRPIKSKGINEIEISSLSKVAVISQRLKKILDLIKWEA